MKSDIQDCEIRIQFNHNFGDTSSAEEIKHLLEYLPEIYKDMVVELEKNRD